ncbi:hypothetical protein CONLIGDRAFT_638350 [Coniochaeta ligniaria NRRL 30616]|uniref:BTB domain-containing protein n=1 Tax=Coniochaeta ligniaria NRRL 30616 TaxID=1408157 RepID=A0A1J7J4L8_9PEZI|nr:hypothetical protein CONLIGDRAFT_638350 [Coniochaeta ligniaria NRRL 30616]
MPTFLTDASIADIMTLVEADSSPECQGGPVYFDPDGELHLEVGSEKVAYVVCPRSLARASPVFKRMLYGGFAEARPADGNWRVQLPDDNPEALALLLNIVHGHFDKIPMGMREIELYEATVLTNKYDMTHTLRPWAQHWLKELPKTKREIPAHRIWIAWEMGDSNLFKTEVDFLQLYCSLNADGDLVDNTKTRTPLRSFVMLESLGISEALAETRFKTIQALVSPVNRLLQSLLGRGEPRPSKCVLNVYTKDEARLCEALVLASFIKALAGANLFPLPQPEDYVGSVEGLYQLIKDMGNNIPSLKVGSSHSNHEKCSPKEELMARVYSGYNSRESIIRETHVAHLKLQAEKSGIS